MAHGEAPPRPGSSFLPDQIQSRLGREGQCGAGQGGDGSWLIGELRERRFPTLKNVEVRCPDLGQPQGSTQHECAMATPRPAKPALMIAGLGPPGKLPQGRPAQYLALRRNIRALGSSPEFCAAARAARRAPQCSALREEIRIRGAFGAGPPPTTIPR